MDYLEIAERDIARYKRKIRDKRSTKRSRKWNGFLLNMTYKTRNTITQLRERYCREYTERY